MKIELNTFGNIISDENSGNIIYSKIKEILKKTDNCIVDFTGIKSMATFNAKQIFGKLYLELGPEGFFQKIEIKNASGDLQLIIKLGIENALEDNEKAEN